MKTQQIKACVHYSGGLMSWGAAKLACEKYGSEHVVLLFSDVGAEDPDVYRFLVQGAAALGAHLEIVRRNPLGKYIKPWDLAFEAKAIPNWKFAICSGQLKREPAQKWMKQNLPDGCPVIMGFSIEEVERIERIRKRKDRYTYEFPLAEKPYTTICDIRGWLADLNIDEPKMYAEGFNHANCNGGCFKAGLSHWARLYKERPEVFAYHERKEKEWQEATGKDMTVCMRKGKQILLSQVRVLVDAGIIEPSYYRLPCACSLVEEEQLELPLNIED